MKTDYFNISMLLFNLIFIECFILCILSIIYIHNTFGATGDNIMGVAAFIAAGVVIFLFITCMRKCGHETN